MFYRIIKIYARIVIKLYIRKLWISDHSVLRKTGPVLLASNHPNSFLDGMIFTTLFDQDVYSLARGDAFRKKWMNRILRWLKLLPVYRTSEGVENLEQNYVTFAACLEVFRKDKIVLIFSEARSENEWHLRPLRKGTARLAITAWQSGIPLTVIPVGINYSGFKSFGKDVHIYFGSEINREILQGHEKDGKQLLSFNNALEMELRPGVYELNASDKKEIRSKFPENIPSWSKVVLFPFALLGVIIHAPFYLPVKAFTHIYFKRSTHYDSVLHGLLMLLYPVYIAVVVVAVAQWELLPALSLIVLLPVLLSAYSRLNFRLI